MESAVSSLVFLDPPGLKEAAIFLVFLAIVIYGSVRSSRSIESARKRAVIASSTRWGWKALAWLGQILTLR